MITKRQKTLLKRFNTPETHLIISRWPSKQKGAEFDGIATYTHETILGFAKKSDASFVVFAEHAEGEPLIERPHKNVLILRIFDSKHPSLFPHILKWLRHFSEIKHVFVHSEFCASSGPQMRVLVLPFLALIKATGRSITYYMHNVVDNFDGIAQHLNLQPGLKTFILTHGLRGYYRVLGKLVDRFVVLEDIIKERLRKYVGKKEITVQLHWVRPAKLTLTQTEAKKKLGLDPKKRVVLSFGFVSYYKGADWFAQAAEYAHKHGLVKQTHFVLAGGAAYSLKQEPYYQKYYNSIESLAARLPNLTLTGFLSEADVAVWMQAADLVVFPYRGLIGGSGALTQALRFKKPFIQSKPMFDAMFTETVNTMLQQSDLSTKEVTFSRNKKAFLSVLSASEQANHSKKLAHYSQYMRKNQSFTTLIKKHYKEVYLPTLQVKENRLVDYIQTRFASLLPEMVR